MLRVPPVTSIPDPAKPPVGASLKVKVMSATSPLFNAVGLLVMVRVGATVSNVNPFSVYPETLPAVSVCFT